MVIKKLLAKLAAVVRKRAHDLAPKVTGQLRESIKILSIDDNEAVVGHDIVPNITVTAHGEKIIYPIFVHEGTGPYTIEPKTKQALHWKGASHPVRKVKHPGIKAQPYFSQALDSQEIDDTINSFGDDMLRELSIEIGKKFKILK